MANRTCTTPGCDKVRKSKGLCSSHYNAAKYTPDERYPKSETPCTHCGKVTLKARSNRRRQFCDYACRDLYSMEHGLGAWSQAPAPKEPAPKVDRRGPLRRALEDGDRDGVIAAVRADCDVRPSGCWEWQRKLHRSGYAAVAVAGRQYQVHRLTLEARLGMPLGEQSAHHVCANTFCVNPDHLQPVTQAANAAEMLARRYMEQRIRDLEAALATVDPRNPLLNEVGVLSQAS